MLDVAGLSGGYGPVEVLRDVAFSVRAGEMLAVVGANGAGKTTLLRTISGLLVPRAGAIRFAGRDIAGHSPSEIVRMGVAHAPEGRRLFAGMTVEENLRLGAYARRDKSRPSIAASIDRVFAHFPRLRERRRQLAGTLSGGEQQMCAIGRALMAEPRLLMIDELSLGLAPLIVEELVHILHAINAAGTTVLLVEQDVAVALGVCSRAVVLQTGRVVLTGDAAALLDDADIIKSYLGG
ncbi:MAG: ABC transporter ATP-binding protein [Alphaproteobacteria bacterium]|nr:ABC transporter ATP-binding protein [Alphaproteobacteria bacterium]